MKTLSTHKKSEKCMICGILRTKKNSKDLCRSKIAILVNAHHMWLDIRYFSWKV